MPAPKQEPPAASDAIRETFAALFPYTPLQHSLRLLGASLAELATTLPALEPPGEATQMETALRAAAADLRYLERFLSALGRSASDRKLLQTDRQLARGAGRLVIRPPRGGRVMARSHVALQARLADCLSGKVVSDPREVPYYRRILGLDGGPWRETANYQAMLVASWIWRVELATLTVEERRLAMAQVRKLYDLEYEQGLFRGECLCPDPHAGMHLEAHTAILCLGAVFGIRELQDLALDWLGRALRLYRALAARDGEPWAPGLRARTKVPRNQAAAALLREVLDLPHRRPNGKIVSDEALATPGTSRDPDYSGALRWLAAIRFESGSVRASLRELATSGPFPHKLLLPLRVVRFDGGLLASLEQAAQPPRNGWLHPVDWLLVRWGRPGKHEAQVGRDWQTPAPEIPGAAQTIG